MTNLTPISCPDCGSIILTGTHLGLRIRLEPHPLTDLGEAHAIRDRIRTWDLWPDLVAKPRSLAHIRGRTRVPRHATHTCGTTYGTPNPAPPRPTTRPEADPPF